MLNKTVLMLVTNPFSPDLRILREAQCLVKDGFKVIVYAWDRKSQYPQSETVKGIFVKRIRLKSVNDSFITRGIALPIFWILLFKRLLSEKFDLIHCHDFDTLPVGVFVKFFNPKIKLIFDSHEHYPSVVSQVAPRIFESLINVFFISLPQFADGIIVVNEYLAKIFNKHKNVVEIMNTPSYDEVGQKSTFSKQGGSFDVFLFGEISANRGLFKLIDAVKKFSNVKLYVAGEGSAEQYVTKVSKSCPNVIFLGYISHEQVLMHLSNADLIPILYSSKFLNNKIATPNKLFLSMSYGKPVVVYSGTLTEQIVKKEHIGFSINEHDTNELTNIIKTLLSDPALSEIIRQNGVKAFTEKYNWEVMESRLTKFYADCLEHKSQYLFDKYSSNTNS